MNKLSRKDIEMLEMLAKTQDSKDALGEYIKQHNKAVKAYKVYRESVVNDVEVDKVVKPVETKRKFRAGDKVRVLGINGALAPAGLRIGDVAVVLKYTSRDDFVMLKSPRQPWYACFDESSLELVEEKSKRKLKVGDKVRVISLANDVATVTGLSVGDVTEVIAYKYDLGWTLANKRPVITAGGLSHNAYFAESALELVEEKSPNELRAEIIEKAKEFVKEQRDDMIVVKADNPHGYVVGVSFIVNAEKRTVVALLRGIISDSVRAKGIAKCLSGDVFNEHIGKAIAFGRALGKDVSEFEDAVQPNEVVPGQIVETFKANSDTYMVAEVQWSDGRYISYPDSVYKEKIGRVCRTSLEYGFKIIDDTNAIYKESVE